MDSPPQKINLISCEPMAHVSDIKLIRTDTTLDLSQKAEKAREKAVTINLEFVKTIVTSKEMQLSDPLHREVLTAYICFTGREWLHVPETAKSLESELPFEFHAYVEISLEAVYNYLDSSVAYQESSTCTNFEGQILLICAKSHTLDRTNIREGAGGLYCKKESYFLYKFGDDNDVEDLQMLLEVEAYFVQLDETVGKRSTRPKVLVFKVVFACLEKYQTQGTIQHEIWMLRFQSCVCLFGLQALIFSEDTAGPTTSSGQQHLFQSHFPTQSRISDIKLIRTDTTLDLSQKAEKGMICSSVVTAYILVTCASTLLTGRDSNGNQFGVYEVQSLLKKCCCLILLAGGSYFVEQLKQLIQHKDQPKFHGAADEH
ncbi:hypothetical protein VNO77_01049 [Canavalia gladiata]|uniref:Uncharacterized protein n=1 Tax=Canavalia gladiata TaxID=3824 RepID=A0AAN9R9W7_CANGL